MISVAGGKSKNGDTTLVEYLQPEFNDIINYELYDNYKVIKYNINCPTYHGHESALSSFKKNTLTLNIQN